MAQYVEKDPRLVYDIITAMSWSWPASITTKQVLFLNELTGVHAAVGDVHAFNPWLARLRSSALFA